jgi:hypothetical protein
MNKCTVNIGKYFREVSIVVIGVAITLFVSHRIGVNTEKRDMALYLNAIKLEAEENIENLNEITVILKDEVAYGNYLRSNDVKSLNRDSVMSYIHICYEIQIHTFNTNAFEMFKSSGVMRFMNDKDLLLSIWDVYEDFNSINEAFNMVNSIKMEEMKKENPQKIAELKEFEGVPMYNYYFAGTSNSLLSACDEISNKLKALVTKLNELKIIKRYQS